MQIFVHLKSTFFNFESSLSEFVKFNEFLDNKIAFKVVPAHDGDNNKTINQEDFLNKDDYLLMSQTSTYSTDSY